MGGGEGNKRRGEVDSEEDMTREGENSEREEEMGDI